MHCTSSRGCPSGRCTWNFHTGSLEAPTGHRGPMTPGEGIALQDTQVCSDHEGWLRPGRHVKTRSLPKLSAYSPRRRFSLSLSSHQHPVTSWEPRVRRLRHRATPRGFVERPPQKRAFCTTDAKSFVLISPPQSPCSERLGMQSLPVQGAPGAVSVR